MSNLAITQRILARNKSVVQDLENHIEYFRIRKHEADEDGRLEDEYCYHDLLKAYKAELVKYVKEQRYLKQLAKGNV